MKRKILILIFVFASISIFAQTVATISGHVLDIANGNPVQSQHVYILADSTMNGNGFAYSNQLITDAFVEAFNNVTGRHNNATSVSVPTTKADSIICPACNAFNLDTSKFCVSCGEKTTVECANCNGTNKVGANFCAKCGASMVVKRKCSSCSAEMAEGQKFCNECGSSA